MRQGINEAQQVIVSLLSIGESQDKVAWLHNDKPVSSSIAVQMLPLGPLQQNIHN